MARSMSSSKHTSSSRSPTDSSLRDRLYDFLRRQPEGATPHQLFALAVDHPGQNGALARAFVQALVENDDRFYWCSDSERWLTRQLPPQEIADTTFVVLDLETTDQGAGSAAIMEIGAVRVSAGKIVAQFEQLVRPGARLSPYVARLTGIDPASLRRQPVLAEVWPRFIEFIAGDVLVAHNAAFDFACLDAAALTFDGRPLTNPKLCTLKLARRLLPEVGRRGLDSLAGHFGIPIIDRHRALGDARITAEVLLQLLEMLARDGVQTLPALLDIQNQNPGRPFVCSLPREKILQLTTAPGIYRLLAEDGALLYVGRAKNLRERVSSYLSYSDGHSEKTMELIALAYDVQVEQHPSELDAAIEEAAAIRRENPPYNRLAKHLPRIAFLRLSLDDEFPRLSISGRLRSGGGLQIGPFRKRSEAERVMSSLTRLFKLRTCPGTLAPDPAIKPCLQGDLHACTAPCAQQVDHDAYREQVEAFMAVIDDRPDGREVLRGLEEQLAEFVGEGVNQRRADIRLVRETIRRQRRFAWLTREASFLILTQAEAYRAVRVYAVRGGRLVLRRTVQHPDELTAVVDQLERCEGQEAGSDVEGTTILAAWLRDRGNDEGYVFPLMPTSIDSALLEDWRVACAALLTSARHS